MVSWLVIGSFSGTRLQAATPPGVVQDSALILVTNDDGPTADGLKALIRSLVQITSEELGGTSLRILVAVPSQSVGNSAHSTVLDYFGPFSRRPTGEAIRLTPESLLGDVTPSAAITEFRAFAISTFSGGQSISATPSDAVRAAVLHILAPGDQPDVLISGVNSGANAGFNISFSGTVGGAQQGAEFGIPSIAVSAGLRFTPFVPANFALGAQVARELAVSIITRQGRFANPDAVFRLGENSFGTFLNVNTPPLGLENGQTVFVQAANNHSAFPRFVNRQETATGFTFDFDATSGIFDPASAESLAQPEDTDVGALARGFVTITPVRGNSTDQAVLAVLNAGAAKARGAAR
jgi:5'-nucleotidase